MRYFQRFHYSRFSKSRLEAFSDAIFAIVITLLVLDIKAPELRNAASGAEVMHAMAAMTPKICCWVISFLFIALMWLHHYNIMRMARASDYGLLWINTGLLLTVTFFPFPTAMLGNAPMQPHIVMLWGLSTALTTLLLAALYSYVARHYLRPEYNAVQVRKNVRKAFIAGPLLYAAGGLLALLSVWVAYVIYVVVALLFILPLDKEVEGTEASDKQQ